MIPKRSGISDEMMTMPLSFFASSRMSWWISNFWPHVDAAGRFVQHQYLRLGQQPATR